LVVIGLLAFGFADGAAAFAAMEYTPYAQNAQ
jgi:hypothetical protein